MKRLLAMFLALVMLCPVAALAADSAVLSEADARLIALKDAKVEEAQIVWMKVAIEHDDGRLQYDLKFALDQTVYSYELDATTGRILEVEKEPAERDDLLVLEALKDTTGKYIGTEKAIAAALTAAGFTADAVEHLSAWLEEDDGQLIYKVQWCVGTREYEYEVDALTGKTRQDD